MIPHDSHPANIAATTIEISLLTARATTYGLVGKRLLLVYAEASGPAYKPNAKGHDGVPTAAAKDHISTSLISLPRRKLDIVQSTNDGEKMTYRTARQPPTPEVGKREGVVHGRFREDAIRRGHHACARAANRSRC